ncbi:N-formylglutamate deformylase [Enhygromyxa salina]|uniref:N-formylglutamate deformylase n=1 Tax=Enhygromyxa salina TaxID=215803 RepID=A0A0C2CXG3_9BACT|nr:N-formylglutamate amidohydrolase [Enhygromyxa salina]KIG12527.1 N-formylglutamate deformylase [Enhygromyxa salina]
MSDFGSTETIAASDVGADPGDPLPFEFRAGVRACPLIISFPHVGLDWPRGLGPRPQVSFPRNADYAVDRLYVRAEALGAATVRARYSRLVVDLNRAHDDVSPEIVPDHPDPRPRASMSRGSDALGPAGPNRTARRPIRNRGVVWRSAVGNIPLLTTLSYAEFTRRLDRFYHPYHRALRLLIERRRRQFGYAILLDAHSMPSTVGGDLVLGTRAGTACGPGLSALAMQALGGQCTHQRGLFGSAWPLTVAIDDPYQGGQIASSFGRPLQHVHALQLEVNRALYMDEYRLEPSPVPDPRELAQLSARARDRFSVGSHEIRSSAQRSRTAQSHTRDQRRLLALVSAIDTLVLELSRERDELAAAAE